MSDDRKQEMIEILESGILSCCVDAAKYINDMGERADYRGHAEALYDRIAPLLEREFPEEEIRKYFRDNLFGVGSVKPQWMDEFIAMLKRLWGGAQKGGCGTGDRRVGMRREGHGRRIGTRRQRADRRQ